jgi:hypothetical protein
MEVYKGGDKRILTILKNYLLLTISTHPFDELEVFEPFAVERLK